jgi:hypothetical protein
MPWLTQLSTIYRAFPRSFLEKARNCLDKGALERLYRVAFLRRSRKMTQQCSVKVTQSKNRISARVLIIIHAAGVCSCSRRREWTRYHPRRWARCGLLFRGSEMGLSCGVSSIELVAEVLKIFRAKLELQNFLDHGREVRQ